MRSGPPAYDAFGNRTAQIFQTSACPTPETSLTATAAYNANNQVTWVANTTPNGFTYDAAGDVTADSLNTYLYDGEGRICAVRSEPIAGTYSMTGYIYDADGTRVAKGSITTLSCDPSVNGFQTQSDYILGLGGEQMTEMAMDTDGSMYVAHNNVWAGGKLLATYDGDGNLHFYLNDPLGTRRVQTDFAGVVEQNCQSLPYGDGESCGPTPTEHLFTGKERDIESGNDYFGARYYASTMGRFMSPDSSTMDILWPVPFANLNNPQSLNLYTYGANNPLRFRDLNGHLHQECQTQHSSSSDGNGNFSITTSEHCNSVPDIWDYQWWGNHARSAGNQAWNSTQRLRFDATRLLKSTKISVEAGVGEEKKIRIGGQKVTLGGSLHAKSTFALGDPSKSTVGVEAEAAADVGVGGHSVGVKAGSVGLETDLEGTTPTGSGPALELGGVEQGTGSDAETTFGGAEYDGIGGGVSISVSTDALSSTIDDLMNLATSGPE